MSSLFSSRSFLRLSSVIISSPTCVISFILSSALGLCMPEVGFCTLKNLAFRFSPIKQYIYNWHGNPLHMAKVTERKLKDGSLERVIEGTVTGKPDVKTVITVHGSFTRSAIRSE